METQLGARSGGSGRLPWVGFVKIGLLMLMQPISEGRVWCHQPVGLKHPLAWAGRRHPMVREIEERAESDKEPSVWFLKGCGLVVTTFAYPN